MNEPPVLKQMTVVQILDTSFRLYRENFALFAGIMAVVYVPGAILMMAAMGLFMTSLPDDARERLHGQFAMPAPQDSARDVDLALTMLVIGLVMVLLTVFLYLLMVPIARGALTRAVADRYLGRPASMGSSYRAVFSIFWRYLGTTLLVGLVVGLGIIACILPGAVLFTLFAFVPMIMIVENQAGTDSMGRSKDLSYGHRWRVFGLLILTILVNGAFGGVLSILVQFVLPLVVDSPTLIQLIDMGASQALSLLMEPIWTVAFILLYFDVRIRKEAFDLQLLAMRAAP